MEPDYSVNVGARMKALRENKRVSLRILAKRSSISVTTLHLIERGKTSPTVTTLLAVARALNLPVLTFFSDTDNEKDFVVYKRRASLQTGAVETLATGLRSQNLRPLLLRLGPHDTFRQEFSSHPGDEFIYCLSGEIECEIDADRIRLNPGDAVTYRADIPHRIRGMSPSGSEILIVFEKLAGFSR